MIQINVHVPTFPCGSRWFECCSQTGDAEPDREREKIPIIFSRRWGGNRPTIQPNRPTERPTCPPLLTAGSWDIRTICTAALATSTGGLRSLRVAIDKVKSYFNEPSPLWEQRRALVCLIKALKLLTVLTELFYYYYCYFFFLSQMLSQLALFNT